MLSKVFAKVYLGKVEAAPEVPHRTFDVKEYLAERLTTVEKMPVPNLETTYRASGLSKICERQEVLMSQMGESITRKIEPSLQMTFDFGHGFHSVVQNKWFSDLLFGDWRCNGCGKKVFGQMRPKACGCGESDFHYLELSFEDKDNYLTGHPDGVLVYPDGKKVLLELKTISSTYFSYVVNSGRPLPDHLDQISIYMMFLKVTEALVIYFSKDDSKVKFYEVHQDEQRLGRLLKKIHLIKSGIRNKQVPSRYVCDSISCARAKRCPVRQSCFSIP